MKRLLYIIAACLLYGVTAPAQISPAAMRQWKDRKYSMFIHFGVYSKLGGVWEGKPVSRGLSEQIRAHAAGLYSDTYEEVAATFDPEKWNPDSIALLAKNAGMGAIVITSKHHDGFALWDCAYTTFDIMDASPYKKDILKGLSEACKRHGIAFGLYFSLIDWHFPAAMPISGHNSDSIPPDHHTYNKNQVTELLSKYGPVSELWFDMGSMTLEQSREMRELVHRLQPDCLIGSRIGNNMGDFTVMGDNQEPDYIIGVPWQSPASFFHETWGYRSWQERGDIRKKEREKLTSLVRVASRGGNFLLNIGPKGDGTVVPFEEETLLAIGDWLKKNGEAIYGTNPDPFHVPFEWGSVTSRENKLYLFMMKQPNNNTILLPGLKGKVKEAYLLEGKIPLKTTSIKEGMLVQVPAGLDVSQWFKVIVLDMPGGYTVPPVNIVPLAKSAELDNGNAFKYFSNATVDYNTSFTSTIKNAWTLQPAASGTFKPVLYYATEEKDRKIKLQLGANTSEVTLDGGEELKLDNDLRNTRFSELYLLGPLYSGVGGTHGDLHNVDLSKPWPRANGQKWAKHPGYANGTQYSLPAGLMTGYYALQEITSPRAQQLLVKVTGGDAVMVFLNGKDLFIQNNPYKKDSIVHYVLLPLSEGKNQLVVKLFNHFKKSLPFNIDYAVPQVYYRKTLPPVEMEKGKYYPVSWQLANPLTPHDEMGMPNLKLEITQ
ncbi:alpha-L-fucosidase [Chitinophaga sp. GCM10012297]|uniref:alpha-L-fucosidase n=1 Tax=Chitinophaga chungangae TaxID=2821488 RepID=A0ABS3YEG8_9BACT|nr:alpha-L-fucosidase [Chitinophaga chungangae]MBO9153077.1 alpha-L-fucosidase [Chitinophaga chungangae]